MAKQVKKRPTPSRKTTATKKTTKVLKPVEKPFKGQTPTTIRFFAKYLWPENFEVFKIGKNGESSYIVLKDLDPNNFEVQTQTQKFTDFFGIEVKII